ncbi:MAG: DUF4265 domain-containing protein [Bacteroidia bacterium]|nr:DUF4265 domain-containing protein [Bacteroidia bacterium]
MSSSDANQNVARLKNSQTLPPFGRQGDGRSSENMSHPEFEVLPENWTAQLIMNEEELGKIHIDLPNHWATGGESFWATPLGDDLFRLENVPFYAYGLNFHDIVRATCDSEEQKPEIREIVAMSGHRTFRVYFEKNIERPIQEEILDSMRDLKISYERATKTFVSLDMQPEGNYQAVFDKLDELEQQNILVFETCDAKREGSFDDLPEENE